MMIKSAILLVVGFLAILIGATMLRDSRYDNKKFQDSLNKLKLPSSNDLANGYNAKCNALSLYGALSVSYGVVVLGLSTVDISQTMVMSVTALGVAMVIVSLAVKKIRSPNPINGS